MSCLLKLEWRIPFKEDIVHVLLIRDVLYDRLFHLIVIVLLLGVQLKGVSNMLLRHDQEVIVADGSFGSSNIEMGTLAPQDQVSVNRLILKAEPAVFVFLLLDSFELEVDLERSTLQDQHLIECDEFLGCFILCKLDEAVWLALSLKLSSFSALYNFLLAAEILEVCKRAMLENESLYFILLYVSIEARYIDEITVTLIQFTLFLLSQFFFLVQFFIVLILSLEKEIAQLKSAVLFALYTRLLNIRLLTENLAKRQVVYSGV